MIKDIFTKKENQLMLFLVFISIVLVLIGFYFLNKGIEENNLPREIPSSNSEIKWTSFNDKYFALNVEYPEHFKIFERETDIGPAFNFYFDKKNEELPFTHFINHNHISIYPEGVVVLGPDRFEYFEQSEYENSKGVTFTVREYLTTEGDVWAIMAIPTELPKNWLSPGFIWVGSKVKNPTTVCFDGVFEKELDYCNPLEGDQFYLNGEINSEFIEIGREFLNRISF
jgi:hypothetical protein